MILPLRVLGSAGALCRTSGAANAPMSLRTFLQEHPCVVGFSGGVGSDYQSLLGLFMGFLYSTDRLVLNTDREKLRLAYKTNSEQLALHAIPCCHKDVRSRKAVPC